MMRERPAPLRVDCRPWQQNEGHACARDRGAAFEGQLTGYEVHPGVKVTAVLPFVVMPLFVHGVAAV